MPSLADKILNQMESSWGITLQRVVSEALLGRPYHVLKGTLRSSPDYDEAWLLALAAEARIVFDIGSNIGQSAILMLHPGCVEKIVLVDPNPRALSQAAQNLILNGLGECACFVCAFVSAQSGQVVDFYTIGTGAAGSMYASHAKTASSMHLKKKVLTTSLDDLVNTYQCTPDLVKIDVEGAERLVLEGGRELALQRKTRFFVEMHSNPELSMHENAQSILDWCQRMDYAAWYLKEKVLLTTPDTVAHRGRCHLLLLPAGKELPESLIDLEQSAPLEKVRLKLG